MLSAKEFLDGMFGEDCYPTDTPDALIEFAQYHVTKALEAAADNANMKGESQHNNNAPDVTSDFIYVVDNDGPDYGYTVNRESILEAYSLENIK